MFMRLLDHQEGIGLLSAGQASWFLTPSKSVVQGCQPICMHGMMSTMPAMRLKTLRSILVSDAFILRLFSSLSYEVVIIRHDLQFLINKAKTSVTAIKAP